MTVGIGSWRPSAENAIPCVEIEQRTEGLQKKKNAQKGALCKVAHSFFLKKGKKVHCPK